MCFVRLVPGQALLQQAVIVPMTKTNFAQGQWAEMLCRAGHNFWETPSHFKLPLLFQIQPLLFCLPIPDSIAAKINFKSSKRKSAKEQQGEDRRRGGDSPLQTAEQQGAVGLGGEQTLERGSSSNCLYFVVGMFFPPLTLQPRVHYSSYEIGIMEKNGSVHLLGIIMCQVLNWEGNFKTILLIWVTGVSYQEPCQRHCSWQETYSIFMILPFTKPRP